MKMSLLVAVGIVPVVSVWGALPHEDPQVNEINRLPARTYSMPLACVDEAFTDDEPTSKWGMSLNGKTEFFRGCPQEWKDVSFENVALSDGRRVSGRRVDGRATISYAK